MHAKYAGSSDEMVTLMRQGGGSQYDMVSASGDASLRLIRGGDVAPMNVGLVPEWKNFIPQLQVAATQHRQRRALRHLVAVGPEHSALQHAQREPGADELVGDLRPRSTRARSRCRTTRSRSPTSRCTSRRRSRSLGITDPYELTEAQLNAPVKLLKEQKPLIKKYWALASDEIELFKNGDAVDRRRLALPVRAR